MNPDICTKINKLTDEYLSSNSKDVSILDEIEYLLKLNEYQSWKLKYDLRLIEHPNKFRRQEQIKTYENMFSSKNAYSKYHLILPLFIFLFTQHKNAKSALETSLDFMHESKGFLKHGDFAKTKTGAQRFITNTRFASLELRNYGLLRSDSKHFYKYWELSLFGILVAGQIYIELEKNQLHIFKNIFNWYEAKDSTQKILQQYTARTQDPEQMKNLFTYLFDEKVITDYYDLYNEKFISFCKYIFKVLKEGYKVNRNSTKDLVSFLNIINSDPEISKLADSIILKNQFDVNFAIIYQIINQKKE